jgi:hypothetical protein
MSLKNFQPATATTLALLTLCICTLAWSKANATQISIDLGASPNITTQVQTGFNDLDGIQLQGQTLSLDFVFTSGEFARLFSVTSPSFTALITLNTSGSGSVGFLDGTGYLLDENGNPLESPELLGSASGDGTMTVGLFPLLSGHFTQPLDFFGIHTDLMLPANSSITITGGNFELLSAGITKQDVFGIGPGVPRDIVPDVGKTILLFAIGLVGLAGIRWSEAWASE